MVNISRRFLLVLLLIGCLGSAGARPVDAAEKVSRPFEYSGYASPDYKGVKKSSHRVETPDGEKLAVDVFIPTHGPKRESFPVLFMYTPYQRATIDPKTGEFGDLSTESIGKFFLPYGYAMACADMRGTGASTGWLMDFMPRICDDGRVLVDWIADQPWCDGNVGMLGGSYLGWSQTATASRRPKALKCIMPAVIPLEGYTGEVYPGGIYLQGFLKLWSGFMYWRHRNYYDAKRGFRPTIPAVDEDGDGEFLDEIPLDTNGDGSFLDEPKRTYSDGNKRQDLYYKATKAHEKNHDYASWASMQFFTDAPSPLGYTIYELGPNAHVRGVMNGGIPIYHVGGWFDGFARGSFELYCTMAGSNPSKILMAPGYHGYAAGGFWKYLGEDPREATRKLFLEHLRFFDQHLKGIPNGIDTEKPIAIYVMNGRGWRRESQWPLARQKITKFHFQPGRRLAEATPTAAGKDAKKVDFTHDSSYGTNNGNRWLGIGGKAPDTLPTRTEKDKMCLTYTSAPMSADVEVTGHPIVHLWVSSTQPYGDFFVYLEDVDEAGRAILVSEGQLRAGFAGLHDNDTIIARGKEHIEVLPELPWHGYESSHYVDKILADGNVVELVIDVHPTSWVFRKRHQIRISIAGADWPTFRLHPRLSPKNDPEADDNVVPTVSVHYGGDHPSCVDLPVIP